MKLIARGPCAGPANPTPEQIAKRADLENEIRVGFVEGLAVRAKIGKALAILGPSGEALYRWTHNSFEDYCFETFKIPGKTAWRLIRDYGASKQIEDRINFASEVADKTGVTVTCLYPILTDDQMLRTVSKLDPDVREKVYDAIMEAPEPPTLQSVKMLVKEHQPPPLQPRKTADPGRFPDHLRTLQGAAEDLNALLNVRKWTYSDGKLLDNLIVSLRLVSRKLKGLVCQGGSE